MFDFLPYFGITVFVYNEIAFKLNTMQKKKSTDFPLKMSHNYYA